MTKYQYYCWRCQSSDHDMSPSVHMKYHEMLDDMRAYGTATCSLKDLGYDIDTKVEIRPPTPVDLMTDIKDKRKTSSFKEEDND